MLCSITDLPILDDEANNDGVSTTSAVKHVTNKQTPPEDGLCRERALLGTTLLMLHNAAMKDFSEYGVQASEITHNTYSSVGSSYSSILTLKPEARNASGIRAMSYASCMSFGAATK